MILARFICGCLRWCGVLLGNQLLQDGNKFGMMLQDTNRASIPFSCRFQIFFHLLRCVFKDGLFLGLILACKDGGVLEQHPQDVVQYLYGFNTAIFITGFLQVLEEFRGVGVTYHLEDPSP
ncbi:hypothetical protein BRADI_4g13517v3 [Brachypodium distachyon]|uniref:Uncharacterized protein n=1 Tax=Brachypodium distachyon TaxID=15368 RepID=A0A2K2CMK8_BRADI|nr:hypothetical protein BRADI_4g13517v3 [Brachypodium distachyon]